MTLYEVLGVHQKASPEVISAAYKALSRVYHPDLPTGNTDKFRAISEAYEILSTPVKRADYDAHLRLEREARRNRRRNGQAQEVPPSFIPQGFPIEEVATAVGVHIVQKKYPGYGTIARLVAPHAQEMLKGLLRGFGR